MIMDDPGANCSVVPNSNAFNVHQHLSDASRLFQQGTYQTATGSGMVSPFGSHMGGHPGAMQHHHAHAAAAAHHQVHPGQAQQHHPHGSAAAAAAVMQAMGAPPHGMGQMPHGLGGASQSLAAALFANSPLISDDLKLAAAAAAAAQSARGKKTHRAEPVPQSGFKGVSWNSRMKAWLAFYVTENGERKSKTFSTRKLGMEEARIQAIAFCKQKQDQRREARKRNREMQSQHCNGMDKLSSDESMMDSPASGLGHLHPGGQGSAGGPSSSSAQQSSLRCGYPTTPGMGMMAPQAPQPAVAPVGQASGGSEIAYVPIVPIAMDMIEKSGLLQPLELNVLPPCQHCNKQPYPFLMIVSEGQEQTYSGSSIMSVAAHGQPGNGPQGCVPQLEASQSNDMDNVGNVSSPVSDSGDVKNEPSAGSDDHQSGGYSVLGQKVSSGDQGTGADVRCGYSLGPHGLSSESSDLARLAQLVHHHPGLDPHGGRDEESGLSPSTGSLMD